MEDKSHPAATQPLTVLVVDDEPEVLAVLRENLPDATFVAITGDIESELAAESLVSGALMCLSKPVSAAALTEILEELAEDRTRVSHANSGLGHRARRGASLSGLLGWAPATS